ncbi:MAG: ATP-binding protein [Bacteriovorax sp.]|nr:ATP-binding protein [Bacteriovorax sp.]
MKYPFKPEEITESFITDFINKNRTETNLFDLKLVPHPTKHQSERKELNRDVVAFLNFKGGLIIYGASNDGEIVGVTDDLDQLKATYNQTMQQGIEPHISGIIFKEVSIGTNSLVVMLIPEGDTKPYCATFPSDSGLDFYNRHDGSKHKMKYSEVKKMMTGVALEDSSSKWNNWRKILKDLILKDNWKHKIDPGPYVLLTFNPAETDPNASLFTPNKVYTAANERFLLRCTGWNYRGIMVDINGAYSIGLMNNEDHANLVCHAFAQAEQNGSIVIYESLDFRARINAKNLGQEFDRQLIKRLEEALQILHSLDMVGKEYELTLTLKGAKGLKVLSKNNFLGALGFPSPGAGIPDHVFDISTKFKVPEKLENANNMILQPIMDLLWRASGWERCFRFTDTNYVAGEYEQY